MATLLSNWPTEITDSIELANMNQLPPPPKPWWTHALFPLLYFIMYYGFCHFILTCKIALLRLSSIPIGIKHELYRWAIPTAVSWPMFAFLRNFPIILYIPCINLHSSKQWTRVLFPSYSHPQLINMYYFSHCCGQPQREAYFGFSNGRAGSSISSGQGYEARGPPNANSTRLDVSAGLGYMTESWRSRL